MNAERNIILKTWKSLENEVIIKDVATKGKHINLCISFLSKRKEINIVEAKKYFYDEVYEYIHRLITNRQLFKAEHVLKNIDESPKYVLYDIWKRTGDESLEEFTIEYLEKNCTGPDEINEIKSNFRLLELIKTNRDVITGIENIDHLNLSGFYKKDYTWRKTIAVEMYFKTNDQAIHCLLEKEGVLDLLIRSKNTRLILNWLTGTFDECDKHWGQLFKNWSFDERMLLRVSEDPLLSRNQLILNGLAHKGYFSAREKNHPLTVIRRILSTSTFDKNINILKTDQEICSQFCKLLRERNLYYPLCHFIKANLLSESVLQEIVEVDNNIKIMVDVLRAPSFNQKSTLGLKYLEKIEGVLIDPIVRFYVEGCTTPDTQHFLDFKEKLRQPTSHDKNVVCHLIEQMYKINLIEFDDQKSSFPHFESKNLCSEFGLLPAGQVTSYPRYLKWCRSSYAIFVFFVDQLRNYSRISKSQITHCARIVTDLAMQNYEKREQAAHCVAFIEMLGFDTSLIRSQLKILHRVISVTGDPLTTTHSLLARYELLTTNDQQPLSNMYAELEVMINFARLHSLIYPENLLRSLASQNKWRELILLIQILKYPIGQVISIVNTSFQNRNIGVNISAAIVNCSNRSRTSRRRSFLRKKTFHETDSVSLITSMTTSTGTESFISSNEFSGYPSNITNPVIDYLSLSQMMDGFNDGGGCPHTINKSSSSANDDVDNKRRMKSNLYRHLIGKGDSIYGILLSMAMEIEPMDGWKTWMMCSIGWPGNVDQEDESAELTKIEVNELIEYSVANGFLRTLNESFEIFFADSPFKLLASYLVKTANYEFSDETNDLLQKYMYANRNQTIKFPTEFTDLDLKQLLVTHFKNNFTTNYHRMLVLRSYCEVDFTFPNDFVHLLKIYDLLKMSYARHPLNKLVHEIIDFTSENQVTNLIEKLMQIGEYEHALQIADHLNYNKKNICQQKWSESMKLTPNALEYNFNECEREMNTYKLDPEILILFFLEVSHKMCDDTELIQKYGLLKMILERIDKYRLGPNVNFNRDRIEYDMTMCYIRGRIVQPDDEIEIYHSEYFKSVLIADNFIIHHSFGELKEIAGVEDMTLINKKLVNDVEIAILDKLILQLIDDGDIVEAIRLQALFDRKPTDLYLLVFCMALAENLVSLYNLTSQERQFLTGKTTNATRRRNFPSFSMSSSPSNTNKQATQSDDTEFEEIPPREKQDVLETIQGIVSRLNHGIVIAERIFMVFRAAMYLDKDYIEVLKIRDAENFLLNITKVDCFNKIVVVSDIITSMKMSKNEIPEFIGDQMAEAIIKSRFYLLQNDNFGKSILWGHDLDRELHKFLTLSPNTIVIGNNLLAYCDALRDYRRNEHESSNGENKYIVKLINMIDNQMLSQKKQNTITVELLIKAHKCFEFECFVEGIATVLQRSKTLNTILATTKSWNLIVRLLTGIGRYREMYYCFDILIKNDQFESLLGKFDNQHLAGFQNAIVSYLHENYPNHGEYYRLTALHFCMHHELAELCMFEANSYVAQIFSKYQKEYERDTIGGVTMKIPFLVGPTDEILDRLKLTMDKFAHAAENFLLTNKLNLAQKAATSAELIALQMNLLNTNKDKSSGGGTGDDKQNQTISVVNIQDANIFRHFVVNDLSFYQTLILTRSYTFEVNWAETIYHQFIKCGRDEYLTDFLTKMELTEFTVENIVKMFQMETNMNRRMENAVIKIIQMVDLVTLKYKFTSILGLKKCIADLINGPSLHYLKDMNYGKCDMITKQ